VVSTAEDTPKIIDVLGNEPTTSQRGPAITKVSQRSNGTVTVIPMGL
jgi:hypothetical protein